MNEVYKETIFRLSTEAEGGEWKVTGTKESDGEVWIKDGEYYAHLYLKVIGLEDLVMPTCDWGEKM